MNHRAAVWTSIAWTLCLVPVSIAEVESERREGEIEGAKVLVVAPKERNGNVLLLAHGYRPKDSPLSAKFREDGDLTRSLLERGWIVASTSYRQNGWVIEDAIDDLRKLLEFVEGEFGGQKQCFVMGNSMGGLIVLRAAEGAIPRLNGAVAIGAALRDYPQRTLYPKLSFEPRVPILFLTNETELDDPKQYRAKVGNDKTALWEVKRPGHCNVSETEQLAAFLAVVRWARGESVEHEKDATIPPPKRESTARPIDGALEGSVTHVAGSWGNLTTSFVQSDLDGLKLSWRDHLVVESDAGRLAATLARHYSELPNGAAVAYVTPEGWLRLQINGKRASEVLKVAEGDKIRLSAGEN